MDSNVKEIAFYQLINIKPREAIVQDTLPMTQGAYFLGIVPLATNIAISPPRLIFLKSAACYPKALHHHKPRAGPCMQQVARELQRVAMSSQNSWDLLIYWTSLSTTVVLTSPGYQCQGSNSHVTLSSSNQVPLKKEHTQTCNHQWRSKCITVLHMNYF